MPRGFSGGGFHHHRPQAQLFQVHHTPEKDECWASKDGTPDGGLLLDGLDVDALASSVDRLIEDGDILDEHVPEGFGDVSPMGGPALSPQISIPPALLEQAGLWGALDPTAPLEGMRPAMVPSGRGASIASGTPMQAPPSRPAEAQQPPPTELHWKSTPQPLITEDCRGMRIETRTCTTAHGTFEATVRMSTPLLFWVARRQWMWHRKWSLPALSVSVRRTSPAPAGAASINSLYVHVTAGTLPEGSVTLEDQGLVGECQSKVTIDANGQATAHFSRLLFKHTSYNCGTRRFHLVVTLLAEAPAAPAPYGNLDANALDAMDAMDITEQHQAFPPSMQQGAEGRGPMVLHALHSVRSEPIHVDARKRSKGERADAAEDDVRLVCRPNQNNVGRAPPNANRGAGVGGQQQGSYADDRQHALGFLSRAGGMGVAQRPGQFGGMFGGGEQQRQSAQQQSATQQSAANTGGGFPAWLGRMLNGGEPKEQPPQPPSTPSVPRSVPQARAPEAANTGNATDAVLTLRADSVVVGLVSPGAFGYSPQQIVGQPLVAISPPSERAELVHTLQVLVRMDQISRLTAGPGGARQSIRLLHHVIVGLSAAGRQPAVVAVDSIVTFVNNGEDQAGFGAAETTLLMMRSRPAVGADALGTFRMLPMQ